MKERRRRGGTLQTLATACLAGAGGYVLGILFAPASGKITRKRLVMRAHNLQRSLNRRIGRTTRVLATKAEFVKDAATEWIAEHVPHGNGRHLVRRRPARAAAH